MSDIAAPAGGRTAASSEEALERSDRRDGGRREPERIGLYPPQRSGRSTRMIGEVVVDLGLADKKTVEECVELARSQGRPTGLVLVEQGVLRHDELARVVAERFGLDYVDLSVYDVDVGATTLLSPQVAQRYRAVPIGFSEDGAVLLAMADPTNVLTVDDVAMMTGRRIRPAAASHEARRDDRGHRRRRGRGGRRPARARRGRGRRADHQARALDRRAGDPPRCV